MIEDSTTERGREPPLSQKAPHEGSAYSHHNHTMAGERSGHSGHDNGSNTGTGAVTGHRCHGRTPASPSSEDRFLGGSMSMSSLLATQHRAHGSTATIHTHWQANHHRGPAAGASVERTRTRGGEVPIGGSHHHPTSGQGSGSPR
jgi:hypothetical protein